MKYCVQSGKSEVEIAELDFSDPTALESEGIVVRDLFDQKIDSLVKITVDNYLRIFYYFASFPTGIPDLTILIVTESSTIFFGGKTISCSIDMRTMKLENEFKHTLFWGFSQEDNGYIVETGETDCLLRDSGGKILGQVPVDPPWEVDYRSDGVYFTSSIYGETVLKFPKT